MRSRDPHLCGPFQDLEGTPRSFMPLGFCKCGKMTICWFLFLKRGSLNYKSFRSHKTASILVLVQFRVGKVDVRRGGPCAWHRCVREQNNNDNNNDGDDHNTQFRSTVAWMLGLPGCFLVSHALSSLFMEPKSGPGNPGLLRLYLCGPLYCIASLVLAGSPLEGSWTDSLQEDEEHPASHGMWAGGQEL